jgi:hypothetical protein
MTKLLLNLIEERITTVMIALAIVLTLPLNFFTEGARDFIFIKTRSSSK